MREINEHIIHCSATRPTWAKGSPTTAKIDEIRRWHTGQGWSDIGYHYVIDRDGTTLSGRPVAREGAGVKGHNTGTIHTCLLGGHGASADDAFEDHFTPEQDAALRKHIGTLDWVHGPLRLSGHNEYAAKGCPGFRVRKWYDADDNFVSNDPPEPDPNGGPGLGPFLSWFFSLFRIKK